MTYAEENGRDWPVGVADFAYAHNTTVHAVTGHTPFFLMHGWEARMPYDLLLESRRPDEPVSVIKYRERLARIVTDATPGKRGSGSEDGE